MLNRLHSFAFSWYCSLILTSALFSAAPQSFQAAAMGSLDAVQAKEQAILSGLRSGVWDVSAPERQAEAPYAAAARVESAQSASSSDEENGPLSEAAQTVYEKGNPKTMNGKLMTALGLTSNDESLVVQQKYIVLQETTQIFNVSRSRGRTDIVFFYRTANEGTLYLTSVQGDLENAVHAAKATGVEKLPLNRAVRADFEKVKAWWLQHYTDPAAVASNQ